MADLEEYEKQELMLGLNAFNEPASLSGIKAWAKLVTNLLFMKKGTFPSDPEMGVEIQMYDYAFYEDIEDDLKDEITTQIRTYLPDIPFSGVEISSTPLTTTSGVALLITIYFNEDDINEATPVVVASSKNGDAFDFVIAM